MKGLTEEERNRMTFNDFRWFMNKDNQAYGTMITVTIGELTLLNPDTESPVTWHDIYSEADLEFREWKQDV